MTRTLIVLSILFIAVPLRAATYSDFIENKIKYKTYFGSCPSKIGGKLTLELTSEFEKTHSMKKNKRENN